MSFFLSEHQQKIQKNNNKLVSLHCSFTVFDYLFVVNENADNILGLEEIEGEDDFEGGVCLPLLL